MKIPRVSDVFPIPSVPEFFAAIFTADPEPNPYRSSAPNRRPRYDRNRLSAHA